MGSRVVRRAGSSPFRRTKTSKRHAARLFVHQLYKKVPFCVGCDMVGRAKRALPVKQCDYIVPFGIFEKAPTLIKTGWALFLESLEKDPCFSMLWRLKYLMET